MVKNLPAVRETQVPSPGQEDPSEKGMATHSSILVWRIPRTEEPGGLQPMGSQRATNMTEALTKNNLRFGVLLKIPPNSNFFPEP